MLEQIAGGVDAKLSRSEARTLRALVKVAIPIYGLQLLNHEPRLSRGMVHLDMERLARRGLVKAEKIHRRYGVRWLFEATDDGRAWVAARPEPEVAR
jgi:hypothetical protein